MPSDLTAAAAQRNGIKIGPQNILKWSLTEGFSSFALAPSVSCCNPNEESCGQRNILVFPIFIIGFCILLRVILKDKLYFLFRKTFICYILYY
jgi:hypothetical protein